MHGAQEVGYDHILPGAHFADTCRTVVCCPALDAPTVAELLFCRPPWWASALMKARDRLVGLLGLKEAGGGPFPVLATGPSEVVMGMEDRHLDFRIVIQVDQVAADKQAVAITTLVRVRNAFGRAYLAAVLPFHWAISRYFMARLPGAVSRLGQS